MALYTLIQKSCSTRCELDGCCAISLVVYEADVNRADSIGCLLSVTAVPAWDASSERIVCSITFYSRLRNLMRSEMSKIHSLLVPIVTFGRV